MEGYGGGAGDEGVTMAGRVQRVRRVHCGAERAWKHRSGFRVSARTWYRGLYGDRQSRVPTYFTADPDRNIFVNTSHSEDKNSLGLGMKVEVPLGDRVELGANYAWTRGRNARSHQVQAVLSVSW